MKYSQMDDLRTLLGAEAYHDFCKTFGGRRVFVPASAGANHPITVALGADLAQCLCKEFRGLTFDVPNTAHKRALIERDLKAGHSPSKIAARYYCTRRNVRYIRAGLDQLPDITPSQMKLL